jgi:hypothetical protein
MMTRLASGLERQLLTPSYESQVRLIARPAATLGATCNVWSVQAVTIEPFTA